MEFDYYDSCLLTSICMTAGSNEGTDLKTIISYIDYVDHSIISWKELSSGLIKLKSIGAVMEKGKKVFPTKPFKVWWDKNYPDKKRLTVLKQVDEVNGYLDTTYSAIQPHHLDSQVELTENDFLKALKEYKKSSSKY